MVQRARKSTAFYRGDAGREKADEELVKQKARQEARKEQQNQPFRFRVKSGESTQFVILDDAPDFYRFEHNLKNPQTGFWDTFTGCVKEFDNCPVCEVAGRESYYALYFSVLDLTPFETRDGTKHDFSRKLLVVKPAQQKKFIRAYSKAEKDGVSLRGAIFESTRDGDKDSAIGNDIEFIEYMDEEELATYIRTWKDKEGKKQSENCSEPYDYEELFEEPDADSLRALVGGDPVPGSRAHERKALGSQAGSTRRRGRADADDADDDPPQTPRSRGRATEYEAPARSERMRGRAAPADHDDDPDGDPEPAARTPARARRGAVEEDAPPPRRGAASRRPAVEDDAPPPRRGAASRRPAASEPDDDDPPPGVGRRLPIRGRR